MTAKVPLPSPLLAIADVDYLGDRLVEGVAAARRGGVEWVLLRAKGLEPRVSEELAENLIKLCPGLSLSMHTGPVIEGAWGIHRASDRLETEEPDAGQPVGYSCHSAKELELAKSAGAAYCLLSPVFAPTSKKGHGAPLGWDGFSELAKTSTLPLYALGGITPERAVGAVKAGAAGVAVLGDLFGAEDIEKRAAKWMAAAGEIFNN